MAQKKIYYANFQKRIKANAIDFGLLALLILVIFTLPTELRTLINTIYAIFVYVYLLIVPSIFRGQTLGKKISKIKLIDNTTHEDISLSQVHLRELYKYLFVILSFINQINFTLGPIHINTTYNQFLRIIALISFVAALFVFIIDAFMVMENYDKRGIHDKMANTIVIDQDYYFNHEYKNDEYEETYYFKTKG